MSSRVALILCLLLAALFGTLSYRAVLTKSPTYDEPTHFGASYAHVFLHDDRTEPENPVLWKWWVMLLIPRDAMPVDPSSKAWLDAGEAYPSESWSIQTLLPGHVSRGWGLINRARFGMMLLGVALCLTTAAWAYRIGGARAAVIASALMTLDPTVLANASLIKNDVPLTLVMLLAMIAMWRAGGHFTVANALALSLGCAVAINVKFSAILVPVIVLLGLLMRALLPSPWTIFRREAASRWHRLLVVPAMLLLIFVMTYVVTWSAYYWRFAPSPDPALTLNTDQPLVGPVDRVAWFAAEHRLLPQAFCIGLIRQHAAIQHTRNYLLGNVSGKGWWYYYPFAFIVKTPIATLLAIALAIVAALKFRLARQTDADDWNWICLLLPITVFLLAAIMSDYNHGLRNLLPIFPMLFIAVAVTFARAMSHWRHAKIVAALLLAGLATESLLAFPNYLSFFNAAAGGSRGGLNLVGDSNLDWGQDLPLLVQWHREHPDVKLYLAYWGPTDPIWLDIQYTPLPGYLSGVPDLPPSPSEPGVLVISATLLQGIYIRPPWDAMYAEIRTWKPRDVLGGSIYIYDFPSPEMKRYR